MAAATTKPRLRVIEVLIISAEGLKNVKHVTKMRSYAHVHVKKDRQTWNEIVKVKFREDLPESDVMAALNVDMYAHGRVRKEKLVGSARVLLCDVLKGGDAAERAENPVQVLTVQVWPGVGAPAGSAEPLGPTDGEVLDKEGVFVV